MLPTEMDAMVLVLVGFALWTGISLIVRIFR
jgi:hypothetical protein